MALDNNTQITDRNTINNWFKTGLKPSQQQFWSTWASFWHKSDTLPIGSIKGLGDLIDGKAEAKHTHSEYATNDATSLSPANVISWQQALGVDDLDYVEIPTENAAENSHPYVVVINDEGKSAKRNATDFGKVDTIDGIEADENKNIALGAVRKSESNEVEAGFDLHQKDGASIGVDANGLKVFKGGITATFGTTSIYVDNLVPDAAYKFQEILFPKRAVKNVEEKVYPVTYIQGVKADETGRVDISGIAWNYTSPSIRYSGILDKSTDATFNQLIGVDSNGYTAKVGLNAVTNAMAKSTDAQKEAFRVASRKSTENYNTSAPIILIANPFLIKNINNYPVNLVITGNNLFIDKVSSSLQIRRIKDVNGNPISDVWIDVTSSINVSEINNSLLAIYHNFKTFPAGYYEMKLTNQIGLSNLTSPLFMIVDNYEDTPINAFEVISNSGNLLSQSTIGYNSTETTIISGLNGGMIFKDLVDIVDGNVNSITTIEISHTNPSTDYDMGEIVAGFTDQAIITPTTMPIVGVKAFYKDWAVRCSDVKNNKDLGISGLGQNNQLNIFKIHLFIKDGTYSILSESHSKVSEGFYTDLSKLNFMLNITRSTSYNGTAPFTASITSLKKIN